LRQKRLSTEGERSPDPQQRESPACHVHLQASPREFLPGWPDFSAVAAGPAGNSFPQVSTTLLKLFFVAISKAR
jgi:hypothetical protein